ncbi:MAG: dicarboxylate/amino acid:cation symporter [Bacteroidetes bacterium]|nr:MAG: dicarboxylate/amino acid:cation symporter [Bacteroidota bacterium]TAG85416.1 MAG: dicarboxylate/amino acid:cation symporter [Bacteroidota bacterium]
MKKLPLHTKIILGLVLGLCAGLASVTLGLDSYWIVGFVKPIGTIFVNLLKMIAVPLVLASLIVGVASLNDVSKLSRIGGKTIVIYIITTAFATTLGLVMANIMRPGDRLPKETKDNLMSMYQVNNENNKKEADKIRSQSPLQPLVDMVPENVVASAADNRLMLQIVFFAVLMGIALIQIDPEKSKVVIQFFDGLNDAIIKVVEYAMALAPYGVFALIASLIVEIAGKDASQALALLYALLWYGATVFIGLVLMVVVVYHAILKIFSKMPFLKFLKGIRPVQLLAFSTSSSNATLPLTMECAEKNLGVSEEVSSFVLPLGATVNMDGTALYQSVAAVFIAQALGMELSIYQQLMIVLTATLASIGSAGVPGAGMVMLVIVLESVNVPTAGIALIVGIDRILDMCRTVVNITGDLVVSVIIAESEHEFKKSTPLE